MNVVAVMTLALALLALPGDACAARSEREPECGEDMPKIAVKTTNMESFEQPWPVYDALYGEDVAATCSAGDTLSLKIQKGERNLAMKENGTYLKTVEINSTTIRWNIRRPDVGRYRYRCLDTVTRCEDNLYLVIKPVVSVVSAGVRHALDASETDTYFVPCGETYQIFCTGSDVESLIIENTRTFERLPTVAVNETSVKHEARADTVGVTYCACSGKEVHWFLLVVNYPPEAQQFSCTSYNWDKLTCTWRSLNTMTTFNLFYTDPYGNKKLLCSDTLGGTNRECKWSNRQDTGELLFQNDDYYLQMQACNEVYCNEQTFLITHSSITKIGPVSELRMLNTSSERAVVAWGAPKDDWLFKHVYKVEYRLLATPWRQADASSVRCNDEECVLELNLECSDQHYELRVFVRYEMAAEERLWSDPASIYFFTTARAADEAQAPVCRAALQEPEPITSREAALSEIGKLIRHTITRKLALKKKVSVMKRKLSEVKALGSIAASSGNAEVSGSII